MQNLLKRDKALHSETFTRWLDGVAGGGRAEVIHWK